MICTCFARESVATGVMNHGNHYHEFNAPCEDDPSSWCNMFTGEGSPTPGQYRY